MEAYPAHNSLPAKAKMEAMDVLTWAWTGNGFLSTTRPFCSGLSLFTFFYRPSPSLRSCCSCPFQSGRMPRIDDAYSFLWRYLPSIPFLQQIYLYTYDTKDDNHDDHGIQTRVVSRVLIRVGKSTSLKEFPSTWLTTINVQLSGVKPTFTATIMIFPMTHLQILLLRELLSRYLTYLSTLILYFLLHHLSLLIDAYRSEFADNYQQEPIETHSHSPIAIPPPYIVDQCASSMSSSKNGSTGNLIETESVLFILS